MLRRRAAGVGKLGACAVLWMLGGVVTLWSEAPNPNGVAVIIGNQTYQHDRVPDVSFADRDAAAFKRYVLDVLGFDPVNVIELHDATQADMETAFGNDRDHKGTLWRYLDPDGSDVVVFYSGHGVPGLEDKRGYLLPTDGDPDTAQINGYPIDLLYEILGKLDEARTVTVYLDACFSGDSHKGMLIGWSASTVYWSAELPEGVATRLTVLTAASGTELASWDEEAEHGLFTNHLLDALYGNGDTNRDGQVTAGEAESYLKQYMTKAARRLFGRKQSAGLRGLPDTVLARSVNGVFPDRPVLLGPVASSPTAPGLPGEHELVLWNDTKNSNNPANYKAYLTKYPNGSFALSAHVRLDELEEKELNLNASERRLIVMGLSAAGYQAGAADGTLGTRARTAIRRWQAARGDPETGSVNADTLQALVALGVGPLVESTLNLDFEQRRVIELALAAEGYDPGPVDGDFGRRTRDAIGRWQAARREPKTGYLDADAAKILLDSETAVDGQP